MQTSLPRLRRDPKSGLRFARNDEADHHASGEASGVPLAMTYGRSHYARNDGADQFAPPAAGSKERTSLRS